MTRLSPLQTHPPLPLIANTVQQALDDRRLVGAVVLVAHHGKLIYQHAAGLADRENRRPMALDTLFRLASVSKPIVSTAALVLVAQGRIKLDDPIDAWLPEFRPRLADGRQATITLRQLLSHTAGLSYRFVERDDNGPYGRAGISDGMDISPYSLSDNLRQLATVPLKYEPGTHWEYSLATDVLGAVIEQVADAPLDQAVRQLVTGPLGMSDTGFCIEDNGRIATAYVSDIPQPHRLGEGERVEVLEDSVGITFHPSRIFNPKAFHSGGAGMVGSAGDVLRLLETLRQGGGHLLPNEWVEEMARDQTGGLELPNIPGWGFGLGFSVLRDSVQAASPESIGTWRWGGAYGHSWFVDRSSGLSVVALTNTFNEGVSGRFVTELRDAVYHTLRTA